MDIEFIRKICLSLPATTEDVKWDNDLVFSVASKMFCAVSLDPPFKCSFKVADEAYEELSRQPGFAPAPYMARARWVMVNNPALLKGSEWEAFLAGSYELVKAKLTKKTRAELGI